MTFDELFAFAPAGLGAWTAPAAPRTDESRLFGGVLLGQAVVAVSEENRRCHSLHGYFIGVGDKQVTFDLRVDATRDGGSFATRQVEIRQQGRLLLAGYSSHHDGDSGPDHQLAMPDLPPPEDLEDQRITRASSARARGHTPVRYIADEMLDIRPFERPLTRAPGELGQRALWFRPRAPVLGGTAVHQAVIAFSSDVGLVHVGLQAHNELGDGAPLQAASLDHAMWFHREARADQWLLHLQRSSTIGHGRGFSYSSIFTRDGHLIASTAQEFLARHRRDP